MTALSAKTTRDRKVGRYLPMTLTNGQTAYHGGAAAVVIGTGKIVTATGAANQIVVGTFHRPPTGAVTADTEVTICLERDLEGVYAVNDTTAPVTAAMVGRVCYVRDDQTVTSTPTGSVAGRVWGVDSVLGVLVEPIVESGLELRPAPAGTLTYASNDAILTAAQCVNGAVYDVPTTGGASTVTLPVTGVPDGTTLVFIADGTKNGHTVQYRFGTTNITAALTASKIHRVQVTKLGSGWGATSTVAP